MRLEHLQLDLRPRSNWQAIDLGYSLLRRNAAKTYAVWWALWGPLTLLLLGLLLLLPPQWSWLPMLTLWWLKPLIERGVVYVLSRAVFGEDLSWREAVRAWPSQLAGGWLRVLTWWRPLVIGRGLYQPIWQLEGARGAFARQRRKALGRRGVYATASWFGVICAHFELVIEFGIMALLGLFISAPDIANPLALIMLGTKAEGIWYSMLTMAVYAVAAGVIGPVYAAGCFTLYLNRRAELEAWDIELAFRRLASRCAGLAKPLASLLLMLVIGTGFMLPAPAARAADCAPPESVRKIIEQRGEPQDAEQASLRASLDTVYAREALRQYDCAPTLQPKHPRETQQQEPSAFRKYFVRLLEALAEILGASADLIKFLLVAAVTALLFWLFYRYRHVLEKLSFSRRHALPDLPDAIAGLDIRPESLPADIPAAVWSTWQAGERRAALALLYRASLSRLAHRHAIALPRGATEGDCLLAAFAAHRDQRLGNAVYRIVQQVTESWQAAAYADRWPDDQAVRQLCQRWQAELDQAEVIR